MQRIAGLSQLTSRYRHVLCDVWGVLHNGVAAWPGAIDALSKFRQQGGTVVMVTNAPRPRDPVMVQLAGLGVPDGVFDDVVTSGDVTRALVERADRNIFHIGPERDKNLYEGLDVNLTSLDNAATVVCTGLYDDRTETPDDYRELLAQIRARSMPIICANPDIVVEVGHTLVYCAGAIAQAYEALGGETRIVGKPFRPIYERAVERLREISGEEIDLSQVLAIGDALATDVAGAAAFGFDVLYVSSGIHAAEYGDPDHPDAAGVEAFLAANSASPVAWIPRLQW